MFVCVSCQPTQNLNKLYKTEIIYTLTYKYLIYFDDIQFYSVCTQFYVIYYPVCV